VGMKRCRGYTGLVLLLSAALLWHGVLAGLPHSHHRSEAPRYLIQCELGATSSPLSHLHTISRLLKSGGCLACLVAGASAAVPARRIDCTPQAAGPEIDFQACHLPGAHHSFHLPGSRAPPFLL